MFHEEWQELSEDACWDLLHGHSLGRIAFRLGPELHIRPINYAVHATSLMFRSAEGNKLVSLLLDQDVAFEIDGTDGDAAWSVLVRGTAVILDEAEAHRSDELRLRPWVGDDKYNVVEIRPVQVTGRSFRLNPQRSGGTEGSDA